MFHLTYLSNFYLDFKCYIKFMLILHNKLRFMDFFHHYSKVTHLPQSALSSSVTFCHLHPQLTVWRIYSWIDLRISDVLFIAFFKNSVFRWKWVEYHMDILFTLSTYNNSCWFIPQQLILIHMVWCLHSTLYSILLYWNSEHSQCRELRYLSLWLWFKQALTRLLLFRGIFQGQQDIIF